MPIYEYRCDSCGHELEKLQKLADEPLTDCPECGRATLKRLISAAGFRLKGGGWYETDFKTGEKKRNLHGEGDKPGGGGEKSGGGEKKTETAKPAETAAKPAETKPAPKAAAA
jgi:putative FmdB family regulatory protein